MASGTIQIVTNTDTVLEPDETLVLKLTAASTAGAVSVATATAEATIEDPGTVTVSVGDAQASEGDSVQFEVELSGAVSSEVKVSYATSDDTGATAAVAGTDYTAVSATELTFRPGEALRQTVSVATAEDELNEADETFTLTITAPDPEVAGVILGDAEAVGTITDDDELTVSVAGPGANVEEGQAATFTVTVTGTSTTAVVVSYEVDTDASTATATDYTAPSETELTISAGVASGTIQIVTNTDTVLEPDETLVLKLTAASTAGAVSVATATAEATIEDPGTVTVSVGDAQASEGDSVQFEVELSGAVSSEVKVSYATSDDTGATAAVAGTDYTAVSATTLTFMAGDTVKTVTVATAEDELNEADETFTLTITAPDPEVAGVSLGDAEAEGTITDDDELTVSVAGPGANVEEGQTATFTVTVTGTSTTAVVVSYEVDTDASTATATDYTAPSGTELTIGAGVASGTIEVVTNTDAVLEPHETLVLKLTAASTAGEVGVSTTAATAAATIEDKGTVTVSVRDAQASEGESVQFVVELTGAVSSEVKVSYATSDGTGANPAAGTDYTAVSATELTFRPGEALRQTVSVATAEDELNEADETFKLTITAPDPEVAGVILGDAEAVGTITDDDELTVSVAGPGANVEEGQTATFTVTVTGTSTTAVVVSYEVDTDASTATATDYTAPSGTELTISAGVASGTIQIVTNTDTVLEPDETLVLKLTAASTAGAVSVATATAEATIEDPGTVTVSVGDAQASEGDSVQFEVELSGAVSSEVKVSYATSDDTGATAAVAGTDYTAVSATTLTFRPGEALRQTVSVATAEDELNEADETFKLTITAPDPEVAGVILGDAEAVGTITDDDELTVSVAGPGANVEEGQTATFTVTVTGTSTTAVVVSYEVDTDASTATATDYTAPSGTELTIGAGEASGTIQIATNTDTVLEPDETLVLKLTAASTAGAVSVATATATATIEDTDTVTVSVKALIVEDDDPDTTDVIETDDKSIVEEGQSAMFAVELSGAVASAVEVSYEASDGTAVAGEDYTAVSATTLTFTAGDTAKTVTVVTLADDVVEAAETFTVSLTAPNLPTDVRLGTSSATGTITDADALLVTVTADEPSVDEGETAAFTVKLSESRRTAAVVVVYEVDTTVSTATAGDDYGAPTGTLTIGAGSTSGTIEIETIADNVLESSETLVVALTSASSDGGPVTVSTTKAQMTIVNTTTGGFVLKEPGSETVQNSAPAQASTTLRRSATADQPIKSVRSANADSCSFPCIVEGESVTRSASLVDEEGNAVLLAPGETLEASYGTSDGTALAGVDYTALSGTVTLTPDQMTFTVTFTTEEDTLHEGDETFSFAIESAKLPDNSMTRRVDVALTIRDDDLQEAVTDSGPTVDIDSPNHLPATGTFSVTIDFSEDVTGFDLTDLSVTNGTAGNFAGADASYTVEVTPRDEFHGSVTVTVPAGVAVDADDDTRSNVAESKSFRVNDGDDGDDGDDRELGRLPGARGIRRHDPVLGDRERLHAGRHRGHEWHGGESRRHRCRVLGGDHTGGRLRRRRDRHRAGERGIGRRQQRQPARERKLRGGHHAGAG